MKKIGCLVLILLFDFFCQPSLTYELEILQSPVGLTAINKSGGYTELTFYALNIESDFDGYKITTGATQSAATDSTTYTDCTFTTPNSSTLNKPLKAQLGVSGGDCSTTAIGPLAQGTWVAIRSHGTRDCTKYGYKTKDECAYSDPAVAQVATSVSPATNASIQAVSNYLTITVTAPAVTSGLGLFYSPDADEANAKAISDINRSDGYCSPGTGTWIIQIGGSFNPAYNCFFPYIYPATGDTIAIRNSDSANLIFPWSDPVSVMAP